MQITTDPTSTVNWGILSTGAIAKTFARNLKHSATGKLLAVASREQSKAEKFGDEFEVAKRFGSYDALLADRDVQAVYIATPHPQHAEWAIRAAAAKKHLLVEKPLALNAAQAMAIIEAAIEHDVFLMEAFMYRCHPQTARLIELIRDEKIIGDVRIIQATFSFHAGFNATSRIFANDLAGGGIMDVGCYPVSMSRLIAGAATGKPFADPIDVKATGHLGTTGVDEWSVASLKFPGDILAQLSTGVSVNQENVVRIFGSDGKIIVNNPWVANRNECEQCTILVHRKGENDPRQIAVPAQFTSFTYEADVVGRAILSGQRQATSPAMSWDDSLGNIRTLDRWREQIGLTYNQEKLAGYPKVTIVGTALSRNPRGPKNNMSYGRIEGFAKDVARLVMGVDNQRTLPHSVVMFDDYFARGGNAFDTSFIYGGGLMERMLGEWMELRGVREQVVTLVKGLHSPDTYPERLAHELPISLERLRTSYTDLYLMHRDNVQVPVGEFVEAINEHIKAGRIKAWGGSNWTLARIDEARDYAKKKGLVGPAVVSNNFSLARMVSPPWAGCISASDPDSRAWFARTQTPLLSWSSQARGFFLPGKAAPDKKEDAELVRCWYAEDNFQRLERANDLARKIGVAPINIALAYVLNQPFPTFALIGPRQLSETRTSLPALDVKLSAEEVTWLNLEG